VQAAPDTSALCVAPVLFASKSEARVGHTVQTHMQVLANLDVYGAPKAPEVREVPDDGADDVDDININDVGVDAGGAQQHGAAIAVSVRSGQILVLVSPPDENDDSTRLSLSHSPSAGSTDPHGLDAALHFWVGPPRVAPR
jgi:hypothetical protein